MKTIALSIAILLVLGLQAQVVPIIEHNDVPTIAPLKLNGPRVGFTYLNQSPVLKEGEFGLSEGSRINPMLSMFGWQFEWKYFQTEDGSAGLIEFIPIIAGLEQGLALPSANFLVGFRTYEGWEFGFGPNVGLTGNGFVIAGGYTFKSGYMNFPVNIAVIPGRDNTRLSVLVGWNKRSR